MGKFSRLSGKTEMEVGVETYISIEAFPVNPQLNCSKCFKKAYFLGFFFRLSRVSQFIVERDVLDKSNFP